MTKQLSFSKYENEVLPGFRQKINMAESVEDVKKFFAYTAQELFENVFEGKLSLEYGDIALQPETEDQFAMSNRLLSSEDFTSIWKGSDLPQVMHRLAKPAVNRYRHLEKHPEKTDQKIRMT